MIEQDRIKKNLRAMARPLGRVTQLRTLGVGWSFLPVKLIASQAGYIDEITRVIFRPAGILYSLGDAPPAAKLHRPGRQLTHFRNRDAPVPLLHKDAVNTLEPELGCQGEADRTAATDENRNSWVFSVLAFDFGHSTFPTNKYIDQAIRTEAVRPSRTGGLICKPP